MGRTSVYLTSDLAARWRATGLPMAEVFRRGLEVIESGPPDLEGTIRRVVREEVRAEMAALPPPVACRGSGYGSGDYSPEAYLSEP